MSDLMIAADTVVTLVYALTDESGNTVDEATAEEPLTYIHGYEQILPGLERGLAGLRAGARPEFSVSPEDGFGLREEEAVLEIAKSDFPNVADVSVGDELVAHAEDGDTIALRVLEILKDSVRVDTNHPLAGKTLKFRGEVRDVRPATDEEIEEAQEELEAELAAGASCCDDPDHDHSEHASSEEAEPLVQLSRKH